MTGNAVVASWLSELLLYIMMLGTNKKACMKKLITALPNQQRNIIRVASFSIRSEQNTLVNITRGIDQRLENVKFLINELNVFIAFGLS